VVRPVLDHAAPVALLERVRARDLGERRAVVVVLNHVGRRDERPLDLEREHAQPIPLLAVGQDRPVPRQPPVDHVVREHDALARRLAVLEDVRDAEVLGESAHERVIGLLVLHDEVPLRVAVRVNAQPIACETVQVELLPDDVGHGQPEVDLLRLDELQARELRHEPEHVRSVLAMGVQPIADGLEDAMDATRHRLRVALGGEHERHSRSRRRALG
jgi:hypothetical protein